jgi:hypothetical protein
MSFIEHWLLYNLFSSSVCDSATKGLIFRLENQLRLEYTWTIYYDWQMGWIIMFKLDRVQI